MKIVIDIPKEFESHFEFDRFADSLARVASDIEALGFKMSGRYERETITMIRKAFENATPLPKGHGELKDASKIRDKIYGEELFYGRDGCEYDYGKGCGFHEARELVESAQTIVEADKEGAEK